jgi:hypothetical protein
MKATQYTQNISIWEVLSKRGPQTALNGGLTPILSICCLSGNIYFTILKYTVEE